MDAGDIGFPSLVMTGLVPVIHGLLATLRAALT
jgi:hypothetical protein